MNKATVGKSIYRGLGSIDIAAAARSVLAVGEAPDMKYRRAEKDNRTLSNFIETLLKIHLEGKADSLSDV